MRALASIFKALSDETRLQMLGLLLTEGELCVCDFVEALAISQSKASRHLRYLWNARILEDRRSGLWVYYRVSRTLDAERQKLVKALGRVFDERDLSELDGKLARWLSRKRCTTACAVEPPRKAPARTPAKTKHKHKARIAAEARQ